MLFTLPYEKLKTPFSNVQSALSKLYSKSSFKAIFHFLNSLLMRAFTSLALLMQSYAIMFCFVLKVLRLKILIQFELFTCFVDVLYFKKLHRHTISNLFLLNKRFMAENVRILLTFPQKQRCDYAFQHSCSSRGVNEFPCESAKVMSSFASFSPEIKNS